MMHVCSKFWLTNKDLFSDVYNPEGSSGPLCGGKGPITWLEEDGQWHTEPDCEACILLSLPKRKEMELD